MHLHDGSDKQIRLSDKNPLKHSIASTNMFQNSIKTRAISTAHNNTRKQLRVTINAFATNQGTMRILSSSNQQVQTSSTCKVTKKNIPFKNQFEKSDSRSTTFYTQQSLGLKSKLNTVKSSVKSRNFLQSRGQNRKLNWSEKSTKIGLTSGIQNQDGDKSNHKKELKLCKNTGLGGSLCPIGVDANENSNEGSKEMKQLTGNTHTLDNSEAKNAMSVDHSQSQSIMIIPTVSGQPAGSTNPLNSFAQNSFHRKHETPDMNLHVHNSNTTTGDISPFVKRAIYDSNSQKRNDSNIIMNSSSTLGMHKADLSCQVLNWNEGQHNLSKQNEKTRCLITAKVNQLK